VKKGDLEFLHFVDIAFREAMTGVDFPTYAASFKKWFGEEPPAPQVGFPGELR
jgi:polar amino acid transport system substrate-binding protein